MKTPAAGGGVIRGSGVVLAVLYLLLVSLPLRCLLFLPGGSSESVSEHCRLVEEWETEEEWMQPKA